MKTLAVSFFLALAALLSGGCASSADANAVGGLSTLREYMVGSFTSAKQAAEDPENFRDIRLETVQIWPDRADGTWLYVEQAVAGALDKPYRQRIYRLTQTSGNTFTSDVYTLPEPALRFAGAWHDPAKLAGLSPEMLTLKDGCSIALTWHQCSAIYTGATTGTGCESTLQGAAYATSEASISPYGMITWDRGFDNSGNQVWGATAGGYIFVKSNLAAQ